MAEQDPRADLTPESDDSEAQDTPSDDSPVAASDAAPTPVEIPIGDTDPLPDQAEPVEETGEPDVPIQTPEAS